MEGKERSREERKGEIRLNRKPVPQDAAQDTYVHFHRLENITFLEFRLA